MDVRGGLAQAKASLDALDHGLKHDTELADFKTQQHHHACDAAICMVK